jgi:cysteine desulfurase
VRRGVALTAHTPGGGQEKKLRGGTENTAGIVGLGVAARLARERLRDSAGVSRLRDRLEEGILAAVEGARAVGAGGPRLPNTSAILFSGLSGEALLIRLDLEGVAVSVGSACSSGTLAPSPAILSLGIPPAQAKSVVRFSLSRLTTVDEIDAVIEIVRRVANEARQLSGPSGVRREA